MSRQVNQRDARARIEHLIDFDAGNLRGRWEAYAPTTITELSDAHIERMREDQVIAENEGTLIFVIYSYDVPIAHASIANHRINDPRPGVGSKTLMGHIDMVRSVWKDKI